MRDLDDASLVERCRRGDRAGWEGLVRRYQRLVFTVARRAGLDEHAAADVFQTTFARLFEALPRIQDPERLQAWLVTTAKRESLLQVSRSRRNVSLTPTEEGGEGDAFDIADESALPEDVLADVQQLDMVRKALDQLDPRCRTLLKLLYRDDGAPAYEDVARMLGTSVGSIGPTRARCLDKLRRLVA
jgi:RNA polymerase sigma factor (sigma-70 family)